MDGSNGWDPTTVGMSSTAVMSATAGMPPKAMRKVAIRDTSMSKDASNSWDVTTGDIGQYGKHNIDAMSSKSIGNSRIGINSKYPFLQFRYSISNMKSEICEFFL
jgi:hypothetical protein